MAIEPISALTTATAISPNDILVVVRGGVTQQSPASNLPSIITPTFTGPVTISNNTATLPAPPATTALQVGGADTTVTRLTLDSFGSSTSFTGRRAEGTNAIKTGLLADETMASFSAIGYTSAGAYSSGSRAQIQFNAGEIWSATAQGAYLAFLTTPLTTTTLTEAMRVQPSGGVSIGTSTDPGIGILYPNKGIKGTVTNDSAATGIVGEFISSTILVGAAVSLTTGTAANVTSISLTAGDWDVSGLVSSVAAGGTTISGFLAWISTTSATAPTSPNSGGYVLLQVTGAAGGNIALPVSTMRMSLASTTTVYLSTLQTFSSTNSAYGFISARRVR